MTNRWWIGFRKVRNDKGRVAHLQFPGFVVSEKMLRDWPLALQEEHLLLGPLVEAEQVVRQLGLGK